MPCFRATAVHPYEEGFLFLLSRVPDRALPCIGAAAPWWFGSLVDHALNLVQVALCLVNEVVVPVLECQFVRLLDQGQGLGRSVKIVGQDYEFLKWALRESQQRKPLNQLRRDARDLWRRYARPHKIVRKVRALLAS